MPSFSLNYFYDSSFNKLNEMFLSLYFLRSGLKTQPWNAKMHYNFGNVLKEEGQTREAIKHYKTALR